MPQRARTGLEPQTSKTPGMTGHAPTLLTRLAFALDRSQAVTDASGSSAFPAAPALEDPRNGPRPACYPKKGAREQLSGPGSMATSHCCMVSSGERPAGAGAGSGDVVRPTPSLMSKTV